MTALVDKYQEEVKRTYFQVWSWKRRGSTKYQNIHSPKYSTANKAKEYLIINSNELPENAKVVKIQDYS